ncbi:MAG: hypothetical protein K2V38_07230, partial [Gemmataceae bacterium]|nr:hypothetical protein [Gemmataceae bacterium]
DPLAGAVPKVPAYQRGRFAGAVGLLAAKAAGAPAINFAQPRQPRAARARGQMKVIFAAALAVLVLGVAAVLGFVVRAGSDDELAAKTAERDAMKEQIDKGKDVVRRAHAVSDWKKREVVYLDELYDLADRMPTDDGMRLKSFTATPTATNLEKDGRPPLTKATATNTGRPIDKKTGKPLPQANVELKVVATSAKPVEAFISAVKNDNPAGPPAAPKGVDLALFADQYYGKTDQFGGGLVGTPGSKFPLEYTVKTQVFHRHPTQFERAATFDPPKRPDPPPPTDPKKGPAKTPK